MITKKKKENVIKEHRINEQDTGSADVQIGILSKRIDELAKHLKINKKDLHSRRGLLQMVADRRTHIRFLKKKSPERYQKIVDKFGLK